MANVLHRQRPFRLQRSPSAIVRCRLAGAAHCGRGTVDSHASRSLNQHPEFNIKGIDLGAEFVATGLPFGDHLVEGVVVHPPKVHQYDTSRV